MPTEKKTVKRRRVKKVTILPRLSEGSSREDFDMQEVNVMRFSDEEPNDELADIARSPSSYPTPDISADLLPLWKTFKDKLPVECMTWSKEQLQTQYEVFKGWAGLTGLMSADGPSAASVNLDLKASASESQAGAAVSASATRSQHKADAEPSSLFARTGDVVLKSCQTDIQEPTLAEKATNNGTDLAAKANVMASARQAAECLTAADDVTRDSKSEPTLPLPLMNGGMQTRKRKAELDGHAKLGADCLTAADDIAQNSKSLSPQRSVSSPFKNGGMQTRKRKADLDGDAVSKKPRNSEKIDTAGRLTWNTARNGKPSDVTPIMPPKRGQGRPRKNRS